MAIQVFGQGAVQTAYVSYLPLDITANSLTLVWPTSYVDMPFTQGGIHYQAIAASMQVTTGLANVNTITLPDATQTTVGANFIMTNIGQSAFTLNKSDGNPLIVLPNTALSNSFWVQLTDNSTAAGVWSVIGFGAGTYIAQATALAGYGLVADNRNKLNTQIPVVSINAPPVLTEADNAKIFIWTGAANTIDLPHVADVPAGYLISFNNNGSGPISIITTDLKLIDGISTLTLGTGQTVTLITDGNNWWSLGLGLGDTNNFTVSPDINVGPGGDFDLTSEQSSFDAINFIGALTSDVVVHMANIQRSWFLSNSTTGNFTLSVQLSNTGNIYVIPQGVMPRQYIQQFFSNTTSLFSAPTSLQSFQVQGQVLAENGTNALPSYSFFSSQDTGMNLLSASAIGFTVGGNNVASLSHLGGLGSFILSESTGVKDFALSASLTNAVFSYNGNVAITIDLSANSKFEGQILVPDGSSSIPSYSFYSDSTTGFSYRSSIPALRASIGGNIVGLFQTDSYAAPTLNAIVAVSPTNISFQFIASNTTGSIAYNNNTAISVASSGNVSFTNRQATLNLLMPPTPTTGDILYYNGTNWINFPAPVVAGAATAYLKITKATGIPFWSDT